MAHDHLFLSPHPDDVVLSCGGLVWELAQAGNRVRVITVMAGSAPEPLPHSPLIAEIHQRWGLGDNPYRQRRAEDRAALESLGAEVIFMDWLDCIYRTDLTGRALYTNDDELFGALQPADPLATAELNLSPYLPFHVVYIPLGAGQHVDHRLVRQHALNWLTDRQNQRLPLPQVYFYQEYPYSGEADAVLRSHHGQTQRLFGQSAIQAACSSLPWGVEPQDVPISSAALHAKIQAMQAYQSQISTFWESAAVMAAKIEADANKIGQASSQNLAERLWRVQ
jgi:LmbE family N-acetylglucosaminyl deacetylase